MRAFTDRLAAALEAVKNLATWRPPVALADQLAAAGRDTKQTLTGMASSAGRPLVSLGGTPAAYARLLAAMDGCAACPHLHMDSPQPCVARLGARDIVCYGCVLTPAVEPAEDADVCDFCRRRGVRVFTPILIQGGAILFAGDACADCVAALTP